MAFQQIPPHITQVLAGTANLQCRSRGKSSLGQNSKTTKNGTRLKASKVASLFRAIATGRPEPAQDCTQNSARTFDHEQHETKPR